MARRHPAKPALARRRRTGEEARTAILDAAERLLVDSGPAGIRLQEVARDVGVSHPTVLHHFGSREGLIEAVVARALDSLHAGLLAAVQEAPKERDQVAAMLDSVYEALVAGGHARAFLWLALSGYAPPMEHLRVRSLAEAVHETRRKLWKDKGKEVPPFEDTYFTVLLPALALLTMSATASPVANGAKRAKGAKAAGEDEVCGPRRFRAWLGRMIHDHLEDG
jgi:AcrR family transcriptional regulator